MEVSTQPTDAAPGRVSPREDPQRGLGGHPGQTVGYGQAYASLQAIMDARSFSLTITGTPVSS